MSWDVFISYATEDREAVAEPLAKALKEAGLAVWYDRFELSMGDRLRRAIEKGLNESTFGIVILSPMFFKKDWPQLELDGLAQREVGDRKVILPIWHNIKADEIRKYSPLLADRIAAMWGDGIPAVVNELFNVISPTISGPYQFELLTNVTTLDIRDTEGKYLHYSSRATLRAIKDNVFETTDEFETDGGLDSFEVSPGKITSLKKTIGKVELKCDLGRNLVTGEEIEQIIRCRYLDSFCERYNYWTTHVVFPTRKLALTLQFPRERSYKSYGTKMKRGTYEFECSVKPQPIIIGGRPCLHIEIERPILDNSYLLEWTW